MHLAELNVGRLLAPTDDPRVAEFMANLDRINGLGKRMPGFVWMMEGAGEPGTGNTDNMIDGDPQFVPNLTVWESVAALEKFVWGTGARGTQADAGPSAGAPRDAAQAGRYRGCLWLGMVERGADV